ncbi:MAG: hypothetical protein FP824_10435 [Euryarchaeota archaeon]|nr:hypothetical protein [Euryarchaeota archaeon]
MVDEEINTGHKKSKLQKRILILAITIAIIIVITLVSMDIYGCFRNDIPEGASPVIAVSVTPTFGNPDYRVWFLYDDGSLFQFSFQRDYNNSGVRYSSYLGNDITIPAMKIIANITGGIPHYWNESDGVIITGSHYDKLSDSEFDYVMNAIDNSNYSEWDRTPVWGGFDIPDWHMIIWNNTSSLSFSIQGDAPDGFDFLRDVIIRCEYLDAK